MNAKKSIREIAEEMNAEAKKKGMHLDQDPWSIPADPNFDIFERLTPEEEALTARLRRERLGRREADKRVAEQVEETQNEIREDVQ
ncbi:MAG: hypothetical protein ACREHD_01685, partial [Pirellulales bacterium]